MEKFWKYKLDHVLFWGITVGFHIYTRTYLVEQAGWAQFFLEIVIRNSLLAVVIYANFEYLIPVYAQQKKILNYALGLMTCLALYVLVKDLHDFYLAVFTYRPPLSFWQYSFYNLSIVLFYSSFSLALELSKQWYFQRERLRQMEVEKLNTELQYLKAQINPHFLFNSINTIFFQIDKQNQTARDTLARFSDMLRYQLYECNGKQIAIEKEISYLENYVELQRMRKEENHQIEFSCEEQLNNFSIEPMLLIPFVENAFKHVSHHSSKTNEIAIKLGKKNHTFFFSVSNSKNGNSITAEAGGIGLKNVKRRLDLLYPEQYELSINDRVNTFDVLLKLPITNHTD